MNNVIANKPIFCTKPPVDSVTLDSTHHHSREAEPISGTTSAFDPGCETPAAEKEAGTGRAQQALEATCNHDVRTKLGQWRREDADSLNTVNDEDDISLAACRSDGTPMRRARVSRVRSISCIENDLSPTLSHTSAI